MSRRQPKAAGSAARRDAAADPYWSGAVAAFVVAQPDRDLMADELTGHGKPRLAGCELPEVVHLVGEPPLDPHGEIIERGLRALGY